MVIEMKLTIVPIGAGGTTTLAGYACIRDCRRLFLQTEKHPAAKLILNSMRPYESMDDLYEQAADFDALNRAIADRLLAACEDAVYAATGRLENSLLPVLREKARLADAEVIVLPGLLPAQAAFPGEDIGRSLSAHALPKACDPSEPITVDELDSAIAAGEAKLLLSEYYPDAWEILFARMDAEGRYQAVRIPLYQLDRQDGYDASCVALIPAAPFSELTRYGYSELHAVMERLRAPGGCPWDREQTHESIRNALIEECYEVLDAIERGNDTDLCEELGDVLLQVVFHEQIAREQFRFHPRDVTTGLVEKLIYRHPHIFGSVRVDSSEEVLRNWDALKKEEKHQRTQTEVLRSVPKNFPALLRSRKVQKRAAAVGFDWPSAEKAFPKIVKETEELREAMATGGNIAEETGDLLFAVVNVARLNHLEPEQLLFDATEKFIARFADMEEAAAAKGKKLEKMTLSEMDELWTEVKNIRNTGKITK